jgi:hypothetical protein
MVTYYCYSFEEALRRAKIAGKKPGVTSVASHSNPAGKALLSTGKGKWWKGMWGGERG